MEELMSADVSINGLAQALDATGVLVAGVRDDQWSNPTPCPQWNVRALLTHLVLGNQRSASTLRGEEPPPRETAQGSPEVDALGDDPVQVYRAAGTALLAAFSQPNVFERVFQVPAGRVPGAVMLHLRITELLVHGWDLARATGQPAQLPDDLAEQELAFARSPHAPDVPRTGQPFGPVQPLADDAPAIDRLAAYLGRPVTPDLPGDERV
jgi:uncharacterized protein (TIGR03086 family)